MEQRQMNEQQQPPDELARLFEAYRAACPDPEATPAFMPSLWQRIESRRKPSNLYGLFSRRVLAGAAALSLAMGLLILKPLAGPAPSLTNNAYLEALADDRQEGLIELEATPGENR